MSSTLTRRRGTRRKLTTTSGSWVVRHLVHTYPAYHIVVLDKLDYCSTLHNLTPITGRPNFTFYHGDITHPPTVLSALRTHAIDTVLHFAAQSHVDLSFGNSFHFTHTNVVGTHVLLESSKAHGIGLFIHVSTDEVYGEVAPAAVDLLETAVLAPTNPYAATKAAGEMLVQAYSKSFNLPTIVVRSNNVYGPFVPSFLALRSR